MSNALKIENLRITTKITLIVALFATIAIGAVGFSAVRMKGIDDAYSDLIARVDTATTLSARATRQAAAYQSRAYQLTQETTDEGNRKLLSDAVRARTPMPREWPRCGKTYPSRARLSTPRWRR